MIEQEEYILRQNAHEVNEKAETLQEMKLYNAMRDGILRGKKRERRHMYSLGTGVVVATAAAVLLTFSFIEAPVTRVVEHSAQTVTTKSWNDSALFRSSSINDPSFASVLDRNLIQPVYQSVEKNGFRVEVMGAVTDGRKVFVLCSVLNQTDKPVIPANFSLDYGAFKAPSIGASLELAGQQSNQIQPRQTTQFIYAVNLSPSVSYPKDVKFNITLTETSEKALMSSSSKYRTSLDVPFELDPDMFKEQKRTFNADRILTVEGQNIKVHQVLYTPLNTYVDLEYDQNNSKQIFQFINPVLIGKRGGIPKNYIIPA